MKHRTHRLRRLSAALAIGVGAVGGVIGVAAGTASASTKNTITAASVTKITKTGSNEKAGNLKLTLINTTAAAFTGSKLKLALSVPTGAVDWQSEVVTGHTVSAVYAAGNGTATLTLTVTEPAHTTGTVTITTVRYTSLTAVGNVTVTPSWKTSAGTATEGTFTPATATNAYATKPSAPTAAIYKVTATATPNLKPTGNGQTAGTWAIKVSGATGHGWAATQTVSATVFTPAGTNCGTQYVLFTGTPTAKVTASTHVSTTPTFTVTTSAGTACSVLNHNKVTLTFTNRGTFTNATGTGSFTITLSGVKYNAHAGTTPTYGNIEVTAAKTGTAITGETKSATGATTGPSNANLAAAVVMANTPAVTVTAKAFNAPISPVNVAEQVAGTIPANSYVCVTLSSVTNHFNAGTKAKASVKSGNGVVATTGKVTYYNGATAATTGTATTAVFKVTTASSATKPATYSVSGLAVNAATAPGTSVSAVVYYSTTTAHCGTAGTTGTTVGKAVAYTINFAKSKRIAGQTAAATAAAQLTYEYPATGTAASCVGTTTTTTTAGIAKRAVILANETHFPDALSSQYLAGRLHTGTLLTMVDTVPAVTLNALRLEGVSHVYIIGGKFVVSTAVMKQLETTPSYICGGSAVRHTTSGAVRTLTVTRISGYTQYDTAAQVATFLAKSSVGTANLAPAYAGVNKTGGMGKFNDTSGKASAAGVSLPEKTAVLASGVVFQDAMSAGPFAYNKGFPVLLTTPTTLSSQAAGAISSLTIKQVILMGGPLAVSNTVVTQLEGLGVSVLRIAGADYTDTATQAAAFEVLPTTQGGLGWKPSAHAYTAAVARGNGFSDGLAGAVVTGNKSWPLLLTENPTTVGPYLTAFLKNAGTAGFGIGDTALNTPNTSATYQLHAVVVFGGTLAITPTVVKTIQTDLTTG